MVGVLVVVVEMTVVVGGDVIACTGRLRVGIGVVSTALDEAAVGNNVVGGLVKGARVGRFVDPTGAGKGCTGTFGDGLCCSKSACTAELVKEQAAAKYARSVAGG